MNDLLALVRAVHFLATIFVAGAVFFRVFVAEAALRPASASLLARVRAGVSFLLAINLAVAMISGAAWIGLLAARIGETSLLDAFGETAWILLTQTQFGTAWQLRVAFAFILAASLWRSHGDAMAVRNIIAVGAGACFAGALAWSGHGAATPGGAGDVHLMADMLHVIATAIWLGGLIPLVMLMRQLIRSPDENGSVLLDALRRFSNLGLIAVATLVVTGVLNTFFMLDSAEAFFGSDYGRALLAKIALFMVMLAFAAINRLKLTPDLASAATTPTVAAQTARRIQMNALAEIGLGVAVIAVVGWLGIMVPNVTVHEHLH
jgi:putative copper resistance protein D